jgi:UDP-N-acetylglucosamine 2-epimerase (non-hydrolysing)
MFTGQHPLRAGQFGLHSYAAAYLDCAGERNPVRHVRKVTAALLPLLRDPPDLMVVQGDTSSALGAALAGFMAGVPVAHVEAGLRTYDPAQPWPEEEYRTAIDAQANLLFAPTDHAAENLVRECVGGEVHVTGNTGIDALLGAISQLPPAETKGRSPARILVTCHRRESWGGGIADIASALAALAADGTARIEVILHPNPQVADRMGELLGGTPNIDLLQPCGHIELVRRMRDADLILSDSGGIQEEAPALGVPLLVLREKTERPEGVTTGNMRLVGTCPQRILAEARLLLSDADALAAMARPAFPYGDGKAAPRIAELICRWLEKGRRNPAKKAVASW